MRLLFCNHCKTLEEIPDYEGTDPVDPLVEALVRKHNERAPMEHGGANISASPMRLMAVDDNDWRTNREKVLAQVNQENKKVGFDAWVYEAMNTYADDALRCYRAHHRPEDGCIDWWDDSKRIGRPTSEGRKVLKDNYKSGATDPHLCQWCPVASFVATQQRLKMGMYDS